MRERPRRLLLLGDLSVEARHLRRLKPLVSNVVTGPTVPEKNSVRRCLRSARYLFACNFPLTAFVRDLVHMDLVVVAETGIVNLDTGAAQRAGVHFTNIPGYSTDAVVQYVLRCILESLRPWQKIFSAASDEPRRRKIGVGIESRSVGLIGFGNVGRKLAGVLLSLGCRVQANARHLFYDANVQWVPLEPLISESDIVVVCCGVYGDSERIIGSAILDRLRPGSILVCISRRTVFNNSELLEALRRRRDVTAWLDFDPDEGDRELAALPNVNLSPHLAFCTKQAIRKRTDRCIDQLEAFLNNAQVLWGSRDRDP